MLRPGSYSIRLNGTVPLPVQRRRRLRVMPRITYNIVGLGVSDPTGPEVIDPSEDPFKPCDPQSTDFCYPNDRHSPDPFIMVDTDELTLPPDQPGDPIWQDANNWYWDPNWLG